MVNIQETIYKGIVVDVLKEENKVIVLMRDGDMKKVTPHRPYEIGEEILFKERIVTKKVINWSRVVSYTSAVAVASLILFMRIPLLSDIDGSIDTKTAQAATLYVESKSGIKVDVDKKQEVTKVTPLDRSAKRVLNGLNWNGEQVGGFIDAYFKEMKDKGCLGKDDKVIVSVVPVTKSEGNDTLKEIKEVVNQDTLIKDNGIKVLTVAIPDEVEKKAEHLGVTPGKLSIVLAAKSIGEKDIPPINKLNTVTVTELIDKNPTVAKILPSYSEEKLAELAEKHDITNNTPANTPAQSINSQTATVATTQSNQSSSETNSTATQNEASKSSENTQTSTSSETKSASDSTDQTDSKNSTEQTQPQPKNSSSEDSSTSSTNNDSKQAPSQEDNQQPPESQPKEGQDQNTNTDKEAPKEKPNTPPSDQQPADSPTQPNKDTESEKGSSDNKEQNQDKQDQDKQDENKQNQDKQDQDKQNQDKQDQNKQDQEKQDQNKQDQEKQDKEKQDNQPTILDRLVAFVQKLIK